MKISFVEKRVRTELALEPACSIRVMRLLVQFQTCICPEFSIALVAEKWAFQGMAPGMDF